MRRGQNPQTMEDVLSSIVDRLTQLEMRRAPSMMELWMQDDEPDTDVIGALWFDTDEPVV